MKLLALRLLGVSIGLWAGAVAERVRGGPSRRRQQQLPPTLATIVSNATQPRILGLRWINADTNQPVAIDTTTSDKSVWVPTGPSGSYPHFIYDYEIAALGGAGLSIEAVTEGPVASVVFERFSWPNTTLRHVENNARWALCGNVGQDFFSCGNIWDTLFSFKVTAYTRQWGSGTPAHVVTTSLATVQTTPNINIHLDTPTKPAMSSNRITLSQGNTPTIISLAQVSSNITFVLDYQLTKWAWQPAQIDFSYDNGTLVSTHVRSGSFSLFGAFYFLGDDSGRFLKYFTPALGRHTLKATVYRQAGIVGTIRIVNFDVTN